ncbi:preprotein translocase subunit SecG [Natranaerovirga hydrolytica]|uniref:Protein-export membrane protein SecG n=1 Tax=Natranaerovirga hydrolytica TaxID=680378 RepID=A0A4R1MYZ2_9FIRM|nr:preprotein translocase subunit SecG [Natranaerovirga hydrolytica]TCK98538.1 preprotein translocase subunit SecG [Natranaerovirga hydrolytica]
MVEFVKVLFLIVCVSLIGIVLMQKGKAAGLSGAFGGSATGDNYWGKNKSRSLEGNLEKITKILAALFFILALIISII